MKCRNKWMLLILCCVIFLNTCYWAYASQNENDSVSKDMEEYSITVTSNEYGGDVNVILYKIEEKYYLSLEDIKSFTRFQMAEDENSIVLTQGIREITIEKNSGYMVDCGFVDQGNIELVEYNGNWLCEAVPMLKYLGASCVINEKGNFEVMMPTATIWEAIMQNYWGYYFNVFQAYGKKNMIISLACDITADLFDGINGHGIFLTSDTYFKDALYEILDVDTMEYKSAQILAGKENENINEFLSAEIKEDLSEILHGGRDPGVDVLKDTINYYIDSYFDSGIIRDEFAWQNLYKNGDFNSSALWSKKINEKICKKFSVKGKVNLAYDILDIGLLAFDTAKTVDNLLQYDEDTRKLFERTITDEILQYTGYDKISWKNLSDKITKDLSNKGSIFRSASIDNIVDYIEGQVTDGGLKTLIAQFTSAAGTYQLGIKLGSFIAGLINYELNKAYAADIKAICLCSIQYDIGQLLSRMMAKEYDEYRFSDRESLEKLKAMFTLYYRTAIAFSKNMAVSIQEFGGKNKKEWVDYFSGESGITNSAAEYLYKITNCEIVPIAKYKDLRDTELIEDKIGKLKMKRMSLEWKQAYIDFLSNMYREPDSLSGEYREIYKLVDINGDDIPELYINSGTTAGGDILCSYYNSEVITQWMWNYGFSYIEGKNLFCDSGGHMDGYCDKVYTIDNGTFAMIYDGEYGAMDNSHVQYDNAGLPIYDYYANGTKVSSEEEYKQALNEVYDKSQAINPYADAEYDNAAGRYIGNGLCDYDEIIEAIKNY